MVRPKYSEFSEEQKESAKVAAKKYYHANKEKCYQRHKEWYTNNKEYALEQQRLKKRQKKLWAIEYLGGCCSSCGGTFHPSIYEFHHLDPMTKDRDPSKMLQLSQGRLQKELDKCKLLCANCHRLEHHGESY